MSISLIFKKYDLFQEIIKVMANYIEKLKNKFQIKEIDSNQPIKVWLFVLVLNIVGFAGYFYLRIKGIHL